MTKKMAIYEGDWFVLPLRRGRNGFGLVARIDLRRKSFLGYFFLRDTLNIPKPEDFAGLGPQDAVLVGAAGAHGFEDSSWQVVHHSPLWDRTLWPIPVFTRVDPLGVEHLETYRDDAMLVPVPATGGADDRIPPGVVHSGLMDPGFVEERLWSILRRMIS